jgi:competence protein ComEA
MDRSAAPWRVLEDTSRPSLEQAAKADGAASHLIGWQAAAGIALAAMLAAAAFLVAAGGPDGGVAVEAGATWDASGGPSPGASAGAPAELVVDVQGAVLRPGVLRLPPGSRVGDAIEAAGGYGPRLDAERAARELNLASLVADGDRIYVPSRDDAAAGAPGPSEASGGGGGLVELNSASESELDTLPGIGPKTAQKIIAARAEQPFASVDDLLARKVVGQSVFDKIRELVTVR